jgi:hypothetical protein
VIKVFSKRKLGERGREVIHWVIKAIPKREASEDTKRKGDERGG